MRIRNPAIVRTGEGALLLPFFCVLKRAGADAGAATAPGLSPAAAGCFSSPERDEKSLGIKFQFMGFFEHFYIGVVFYALK